MHSKLIVVSNRLPIILKKGSEGRLILQPGTGGLVTALAPVLRDRGGLWIGWTGGANLDSRKLKSVLTEQAPKIGFDLHPIQLDAEEVEKFYHGFANEILWPLFHDIPSRCHFDPSFWPVYKQVNKRYAEAIKNHTAAEDYIWIQDYHLLLVGDELRKLGVNRKTGFFLHIPFPSVDIFLKLPWRYEILAAMMNYNLIGFQTPRDRLNFLNCVRTLLSGCKIKGGKQVCAVRTPEREIRVGTFPISIDFDEFAHRASLTLVKDMTDEIKAIHKNRQLILGIDRLDYSKGIPERIKAYGLALDLYPELRGKTTLVQVIIPSRTNVQEYKWLKRDIERHIGEINGRFTQMGWAPIHYLYRTLDGTELLAYYRACEIALVTPLKDGMNLVAKEFCAASLEEESVLILSESAGAASQLHTGALLINPNDINGMADAIRKATLMSKKERRLRMQGIRTFLKKNNVYYWVDSFLRAAFARNLNDFPRIHYYPHVRKRPALEKKQRTKRMIHKK